MKKAKLLRQVQPKSEGVWPCVQGRTRIARGVNQRVREPMVIIVTSLINDAREKRLLQTGAVAVVPKPLTLPMINKVLSKQLQETERIS